MAFWWGVGQILPYDWLYVAGIGPADFVFLFLLAAMVASGQGLAAFRGLPAGVVVIFRLVLALVGLVLASIVANAFTWDIAGEDLIEALRPLYFFALVVFVYHWTRQYGESVLIAFLCGIVASGLVAFLDPARDDVLGFRMLWNPNVIGNMLAIGSVMTSLLVIRGRPVVGFALLAAFLLLAVFSYSKGTWLMSLLGSLACIIAALGSADSRTARTGRFALVVAVVGLSVMLATHLDALVELVLFKLSTTQFGDTASEGGTFAARLGFVIASVQLAVDNPLLGVGITNFGAAYDSLRDYLGSYYWATDNPHSAWLYVLACMGIPALVVVVLIVLATLMEIRRFVRLNAFLTATYLVLFGAIFAISGAVVLHVLTQYYLWFLLGFAFGAGRDDAVLGGTDTSGRRAAPGPAVGVGALQT